MKKKKEHIGERRYFVQEDKNMIVEKVVEPLTVIDEVYKSENRLLRKLAEAYMWYGDRYMSDNDGTDIVARAVCDERDTFNEQFGKKLCDTKVELKYHMRMFNNYENFIKYLKNAIIMLSDLKNEHADKALKLQDDLTEMYKGDNA